MRIEFQIIGNGTNIEVSLIDNDDLPVDRVYTSDHQGGLHYGEEQGAPIRAVDLFEWVEQSWAKPIIGGLYGRFHPYWSEREEKQKLREAAQ